MQLLVFDDEVENGMERFPVLAIFCLMYIERWIIMIDFTKQINVKIKVSTSRNEPKAFRAVLFVHLRKCSMHA